MLRSCGCSSSGHWSFGLHSSRRHTHVSLRSSSYPRVHGSFGALFGRCGSASHPRFKPSVQAISGSIFDLDAQGFHLLATSPPDGFAVDEITLFGRDRGVEDMPFCCLLPSRTHEPVSFCWRKRRIGLRVTSLLKKEMLATTLQKPKLAHDLRSISCWTNC